MRQEFMRNVLHTNVREKIKALKRLKIKLNTDL